MLKLPSLIFLLLHQSFNKFINLYPCISFFLSLCPLVSAFTFPPHKYQSHTHQKYYRATHLNAITSSFTLVRLNNTQACMCTCYTEASVRSAFGLSRLHQINWAYIQSSYLKTTFSIHFHCDGTKGSPVETKSSSCHQPTCTIKNRQMCIMLYWKTLPERMGCLKSVMCLSRYHWVVLL